MSKFEQLLLFEDPRSEFEILGCDLSVLTDHVDILRKGLFKRFSTLSSELRSAENRISMLEQQLYISMQSHRYLENRMCDLENTISNMRKNNENS